MSITEGAVKTPNEFNAPAEGLANLAGHECVTQNPITAGRNYSMAHTRVDALMFGCLAALLSGNVNVENAYRTVERWVWLFPIFVCVVSPFLTRRWGGAYIYIVGLSLEGAMICLTIIWLVRNSSSVAGRILNSGLAVHVGIISYTLYLWQQLLLNGENKSHFGKFPFNLTCLLVASEVSDYFIERRCLEWRRRFEVPREASGHRNALTKALPWN